MSRYRALRRLGCGPIGSGFIAFLNWMRGHPSNRIVFLSVEIDLD